MRKRISKEERSTCVEFIFKLMREKFKGVFTASEMKNYFEYLGLKLTSGTRHNLPSWMEPEMKNYRIPGTNNYTFNEEIKKELTTDKSYTFDSILGGTR